MKQITISLLTLILFSIQVQAQQTSIIKTLPHHSAGFLIIDKQALPDLSHWELSVIERVFFNEKEYGDKVIFSTTFKGVNYIKVPPQYLNQRDRIFLITVTAYNPLGIVIGEEGPSLIGDPENTPTFGCDWDCVGSDYAWSIYQTILPGGTQFQYSLGSAGDYFDPVLSLNIPYYEYMSSTQFTQVQNLIGQSLSEYTAYHQISSTDISLPPNTSTRIIRFTNPGSPTYYNSQGAAITTSQIYGVKKGMGPWAGVFATTSILTADWCSSFSGGLAPQLVSNFNTYSTPSDGTSDLSCNGEVSGGVSAPDENPEPFGVLLDCFYAAAFENEDLWPVLMNLNNCLQIPGPDDTAPVNFWPAGLNQITISRVDDEGLNLTITKADLFGSNGELTVPSFTLTEGVYIYHFFFNNGWYVPRYVEITKPRTTTVALSSLLEVNCFPVPVTDNEFQVTLSADAKLKFDHVLFDGSGNELYRKNHVIQKDHSITHTVKPKGNLVLPEGLLVNQFIFEDGSTKSVTITKFKP